MRTPLLALSLMTAITHAEDIVLPNDSVVAQDKSYYTQDSGNTRIIYTKDNQDHAEYAASFEKILQPLYGKTFGYEFDTQLSVVLASSYNQIANGFSTQYPLNRQVNYMGGAQVPDYFASASWLDVLLLHETAHNYQTNVKDNAISRSMYSVFRNGGFFLPFFPATTPNIFEANFILEGNAVLNESWHGRGGRLYSGRYRAMNHLFALEGKLRKEIWYNTPLEFPYGESSYVFGSQYQYYLAQNYGLDVTNHYFKKRSKDWYWPFRVNAPSIKTFGASFETLFHLWSEKMKRDGKGFKTAQGETLARSQYYSDMNTQADRVLFLAIEDGVQSPTLFQYDVKSSQLSSEDKSLALGRVFLLEDEYYTVSGRHTSPWRITQGLFDEDAIIKQDTEGKVIQGYMNDGRAVYFDTAKSFVSPQLFVGEEFYAPVNSSVLVQDDHLYYFVQNGSERVLYKDKQALYSFEGYYSIVADVDENGAVYFIANSKLGSTLYQVKNSRVTRVLDADNVVAAKLAGNNQMIVEAISTQGYYYTLQTMKAQPQEPYAVNYMWDDPEHPLHKHSKSFDNIPPQALNTEEEYTFFNNFNYTAGSFISAQTEDGESTYLASIMFSDPLHYHELSVKAQKDEYQSTMLGMRYSNNQHFLLYGVDAFYVAKDGIKELGITDKTRDYGVALDLKLPFLRSGYWSGQLQAGYYQDYINIEREPTSVGVNVSFAQYFGHSMFVNELAFMDVYATQDRGDNIQGAQFNFSTDLPNEFYTGFKFKHSESNAEANRFQRRGVELSAAPNFFGYEPSGFIMPSLTDDVFAESVTLSEVNVSKVFNASAYYFSFPFSLRREALTLSYRHYDIKNVSASTVYDEVELNQTALKLTLDVAVMNKFNINFIIEAIHNDNDDLTDEDFVFMGIELAL